VTSLNIDRIVAFTTNRVYAGEVGDDIAQIGSGGLSGRGVEAVTRFDPRDGKNKVWAVDGTGAIIVDVDGDEVETWASAVSNDGTGTLPQGCGLIANYRGSVYLARQPLNPSAWYKSRSLNPLDWGFANDPLATAPVAGAGFDGGEVGDAINALIPFSDDYLIFGCASSLYVLEGDPNFGGAVTIISPKTGILGARAFVFDEYGTLYFVGSSGLFKMPRGSFTPEPLSHGKIDELVGRLNPETLEIEMGYDEVDQVVHCFLRPADGTTVGEHVIYEVRADAFRTDKYPLVVGPTAVTTPSGSSDPEDRRVWLGGSDGYIRRFDSDTVNDDGSAGAEAMECVVRFPAIEAEGGVRQIMLNELMAFGATGNDPVTWNIYAGFSPEEVNQQTTPARTGTWFDDGQPDGFQTPQRVRARGGAIQYEITQNALDDTFSFERFIMFMDMETGGIQRRRRASS